MSKTNQKYFVLLIVQLICAILTPDTRVLEFGSGGSTTLFSPFVKQWTSIEHNTYWAVSVNKTTKLI